MNATWTILTERYIFITFARETPALGPGWLTYCGMMGNGPDMPRPVSGV